MALVIKILPKVVTWSGLNGDIRQLLLFTEISALAVKLSSFKPQFQVIALSLSGSRPTRRGLSFVRSSLCQLAVIFFFFFFQSDTLNPCMSSRFFSFGNFNLLFG